MIRALVIGAALAFSFAAASNAAIMPVPVGPSSDPTIRVAEGCGAGFWRGGGLVAAAIHSHRAGSARSDITSGREGRRCWPN